VITELELQTIPNLTSFQLNSKKQLIADCQIIDLLEGVKSKAIEIRKIDKLKLPDAIIAASAAHCNMPLFTADKGFQKLSSVDVVLYEIGE
jgi:predicted nucleic acid-binding protein